MRAGHLGLQIRRDRLTFKYLRNFCYLSGSFLCVCTELSAPGSALSSGKGSLPVPFQRPPAFLAECRVGACTCTVCVASWEACESDSGLGKSCAAQWCHPWWHDRVLLGVEAGFIYIFVYLFLNKWSSAMLGGCAPVSDLGSTIFSFRFTFLGDGRWVWDFRARQDGPKIKVSCIWMPFPWNGFNCLSYPN